MRLSKFDLAAIAAVTAALLFVEYGNRVMIEAPRQTQVSAQAAPTCPANESVPFSAECMAFIQTPPVAPDLRRLNSADLATIDSPEQP
jgi:hypothetical protein